MKPFSVFISYSRQDKAEFLELQKWLRPLVRKGLISIWSDVELLPGEKWNSRIRRELERCDVILLLVSSEFLASDYVTSVEVKAAIDRNRRGEALVIPIIIKRSLWEDDPELSALQALPEKAMPLAGWEDPDEFFYSVLEGLKRAMERFARDRRVEVIGESVSSLLLEGEGISLPTDNQIDYSAVRELRTSLISWVVGVDDARYFKPEDHKVSSTSRGLEDLVVVDTIHAGDYVPSQFLPYFDGFESKTRLHSCINQSRT